MGEGEGFNGGYEGGSGRMRDVGVVEGVLLTLILVGGGGMI